MTTRKDPDQSPVLLARQLAIELTRRREATGMSREDVARRLEWSTSTLFRIETGRSRPQPRSVRDLLDLYGVTGTEREGLMRLAREARKPGWWHSFRDVLDNPYEVYIGLEAGAASILEFEPLVIPGLLQTADYARAVSRGGPRELEPDEIERRVEVRMARQQLLTDKDGPRLWVIIDEAAIRRVAGGPDVMRAQLHYLIKAAERGKTTVQVVPFTVGIHAGITGPFVILGFPDPAVPDLVYLETGTDDLYLEGVRDVERYTLAFDRLRAAALPPDDSVALIERAARELE